MLEFTVFNPHQVSFQVGESNRSRQEETETAVSANILNCVPFKEAPSFCHSGLLPCTRGNGAHTAKSASTHS